MALKNVIKEDKNLEVYFDGGIRSGRYSKAIALGAEEYLWKALSLWIRSIRFRGS